MKLIRFEEFCFIWHVKDGYGWVCFTVECRESYSIRPNLRATSHVAENKKATVKNWPNSTKFCHSLQGTWHFGPCGSVSILLKFRTILEYSWLKPSRKSARSDWFLPLMWMEAPKPKTGMGDASYCSWFDLSHDMSISPMSLLNLGFFSFTFNLVSSIRSK